MQNPIAGRPHPKTSGAIGACGAARALRSRIIAGAGGWLVAAMALLAAAGCARTARDTTGFSITEVKTVNAPFEETWQAVKSVLREKDFDIYTRDKRGIFVAFSKMRRNLVLTPHRTKYTLCIETVSDNATQLTAEAVKQVYGVTLLTYPGWHDRKLTDNTELQDIVQAVEAKVSAETAKPPA